MSDKITVTRASLPEFEEYIAMIKPLWDSHWITNMGAYHRELEERLREYLQAPCLSLMVNGHMSLEMAIQAMDFPEGSEVITTPFTFVSTTHAIVRNRLKPVFCDIKLSDYTIDETKLEALITERTVAVLPVHVYGNVCNMDAIQEIADRYNLRVIYDAAHAFGENVDGRGIGSFGDASIFSFHATKVFNTIEGGAIAFEDSRLYKRFYDLKNFGIRSEELVAEVGANAKMNEFCAAMGLCNLKHIEDNIEARRIRVTRYLKRLSDMEGLVLPSYGKRNMKYNYGYFPVLLPPSRFGPQARERVYEALLRKGIRTRKYFYPLTSDQACFKNKYKALPLLNARYAAENILVLPLYPELAEEMIDVICDSLGEALRG